MTPISRIAAALAAIALGLLALTGCDPQRISELEEDVSTEADVRDRFGVPENVWQEPDGSHTLEYNRQPAGHQNYMITIGPNGKMTALRQVLAPHNFEKVQPGMAQDQVRRMLGKPAKRTTYELKQETEWDWNWTDAPTRDMVFTVVFGPDGLVKRSGSTDKLPDGR
ncbi:outer membrane protein assembly factor BamE domain-containing protein [Paenacidovorax monticola]|uniref:Outer membrane protein assembly factor BamE n=1 Tax=Paenacidovorax monticola TaxID=1926868 RepID=A0A7H0HKW6_9BURK|nr:outer membrane protein assembly factor BamE [Paenacidovorax monticola]QNP61182.1 outer membrane protein assembly factor BamE [Paenacidovorax monticola]